MGIDPPYTQALIRRRRVAPPQPGAQYEAWPWPLKIYTLGRFEVLIDGEPLKFSGKAPRKVIALLKLLVACGTGGAESETLADLLWPDSDGDAAQRAFSINLHRLRQLLGSDQTLQLKDGLKIDPQQCWVDAHAFETLLTLSQAAPPAEEEARLVEAALRLYQGPFLGSFENPCHRKTAVRIRITSAIGQTLHQRFHRRICLPL